MRKYLLFAVALLAPIYIAGCIATGTLVFIFDINEFVSSSDGIEVVEVDLTTNNDYNDHKDKIKSIDQVTVVGWLINQTGSDNFAEIWLADVGTYSNPAEVRANATPIFTSPSVPGNDSIFINWSDGLGHIQNLETLKDAVDGGYFWLYGLAQNSPFVMRFRLSLIVTMTAGV